MKYTHTVTTAVTYKIRPEGIQGGWADITLNDEGEGRGRLSIASDYGNWQYYWGSMGKGFKEFLIGISDDYLFRKLSNQYVFSEDATKRAIYNDIKEARKNQELTTEEAKEMCDNIESYISEHPSDVDELLYFTKKIYDNDPSCIPFQHDIEPGINAFLDGPWKAFAEILKEEINNQ